MPRSTEGGPEDIQKRHTKDTEEAQKRPGKCLEDIKKHNKPLKTFAFSKKHKIKSKSREACLKILSSSNTNSKSAKLAPKSSKETTSKHKNTSNHGRTYSKNTKLAPKNTKLSSKRFRRQKSPEAQIGLLGHPSKKAPKAKKRKKLAAKNIKISKCGYRRRKTQEFCSNGQKSKI